ncbi:unnamed protein product [Bursaphelenchus okinawaensis]|uniref:Uncharacterized protein n=1 Tax=Bursaphelenchus okinawaensis TaxID=465554 RepID=A0A811LC03_9BILA|nr:unnamed protein product [Bursaphelenchus okinawaensis]CAG9121225.1 unnamed protein product [Bursaphelenchus okinawaensis]
MPQVIMIISVLPPLSELLLTVGVTFVIIDRLLILKFVVAKFKRPLLKVSLVTLMVCGLSFVAVVYCVQKPYEEILECNTFICVTSNYVRFSAMVRCVCSAMNLLLSVLAGFMFLYVKRSVKHKSKHPKYFIFVLVSNECIMGFSVASFGYMILNEHSTFGNYAVFLGLGYSFEHLLMIVTYLFAFRRARHQSNVITVTSMSSK